MRSALASVDGVENVEIDFAAQTATVTCSGSCPTEEMVSALKATKKYGGVVHK